MAINSVQTLAAKFRTAAADGVITRGEVSAIIREAAKNTLTGPERKELARQLSVRSSFAADARAQLQSFVAAASKPADNADPAVMNKDRAYLRYSDSSGALFKDGVSYRDVKQGSAGDCYFLSTLSAAAKVRPGLISGAFTRKSDGSYLVRFFAKNADGSSRPVYIPVDDELARRPRYGTWYAKSTNGSELWVSLMEKAFAKWKGGYEKIGNGGLPSDVMFALTGKAADYTPTASVPAADLHARLRSLLAAKELVVAASRSGPQYRGSGIVEKHAYTVVGASVQENGVKTVTLRNPWAHTEPGGGRSADGVFTLSLANFLKYYPDLWASTKIS